MSSEGPGMKKHGEKNVEKQLERERIERQELIIEGKTEVKASQWSNGRWREEGERKKMPKI